LYVFVFLLFILNMIDFVVLNKPRETRLF
jgi:hypothetical protein